MNNFATKLKFVPQKKTVYGGHKLLLAKRKNAEKRFKFFGLVTVLFSGFFLLLLLTTVIIDAIPAFTYHYVKLPFDIPKKHIDTKKSTNANYDKIFRSAVKSMFPYVSGRRNTRVVRGIFSAGAANELRKAIYDNLDLTGENLTGENSELFIPLSDHADLYLKGMLTEKFKYNIAGLPTSIVIDGKKITINTFKESLEPVIQIAKKYILKIAYVQKKQLAKLEATRDQLVTLIKNNKNDSRIEMYQKSLEKVKNSIIKKQMKLDSLIVQGKEFHETLYLDKDLPTILLSINGGIIKVNRINPYVIKGDIIIPFDANKTSKTSELTNFLAVDVESWSSLVLVDPENSRKINDYQVSYIEKLVSENRVEKRLNWNFFTNGSSREPELAGIWGAVTGTFFTMIVTLVISFPIGVAAAIYLEEFASQNAFTRIIEVNINNLAAVPSIIFGLLGLAVFLNYFGMPRSAPVVGGLVLSLMTLPVIIIASRAALKSVPPSIRQAALGVGASDLQAVFHHVVPLAMPGILTGTIIGMARAIGESAPLLMIGMVAFIVDIPQWFDEPATVLPVQIYMWADFPEMAFRQRNSAAILVLLVFLLLMNGMAILLRKRFERRW